MGPGPGATTEPSIGAGPGATEEPSVGPRAGRVAGMYHKAISKLANTCIYIYIYMHIFIFIRRLGCEARCFHARKNKLLLIGASQPSPPSQPG